MGLGLDGVVKDIIGDVCCCAVFVGMGGDGACCVVADDFCGAVGVLNRKGLVKGVIRFLSYVSFGVDLFEGVSENVVFFTFCGSIGVIDRGDSSNEIVFKVGFVAARVDFSDDLA